MLKNTRQDKNTEKTIKEWELEKGIKLMNTKGFHCSKQKAYSQRYSDRLFRIYAQKCTIKCKTEKGLNFLNK